MDVDLRKPLVFTHVYSSAPWGGAGIAEAFGRGDVPEICSESWEISGHPFGMSRVRGGKFDGMTLAELAARYGTELTGRKAPDPYQFPLLFKLIDARESLSVQVHPNHRNAMLTGGTPKTEAWVVLDAKPGAYLYAGLVPGTTEVSLRSAVDGGAKVLERLLRYAVNAGDVLFVPGGMAHAIGAGCLIYEVQQSSNTTYRLYDWDRRDEQGRGRALHIEQALKSIEYGIAPQPLRHLQDGITHNQWRTVVKSAYFRVRDVILAREQVAPLDGGSFIAVFVAEGKAVVASGGEEVLLEHGASALIPACATTCSFKPVEGSARLLLSSL